MARNMFVLTGAGASAESGLGTFRDKGEGIWARFDPMKLATPEGFRARPRNGARLLRRAAATCSPPRRMPPISRLQGSRRNWRGGADI